MTQTMENMILNVKAAWAVVGSTFATSIGLLFELIPNDIGKLGTVIAIIFSVILIRMHILNTRKIQLEIEILKKERARNVGQSAKNR